MLNDTCIRLRSYIIFSERSKNNGITFGNRLKLPSVMGKNCAEMLTKETTFTAFIFRRGKGKSLRKRIKASFRRKTSKSDREASSNAAAEESKRDQEDASCSGGSIKSCSSSKKDRKKSSSVSINPTPSIIPGGETDTPSGTPATPKRSPRKELAAAACAPGSAPGSPLPVIKTSAMKSMGVKRTHLTVEDAENRW